MVEEDAVAGEYPVALTVVDGDVIGVGLGAGVWGAWVERGGLALGSFQDPAVEFRGGGLVESRLQSCLADSLEDAHRAQGVHLSGVFGDIKGDLDMALGAQVVYLVGPHVPQHLVKGAGVVQVAVVEEHADARLVGVPVYVVYPAGIERGRTADDAVHLVSLVQEEFRQIGSVLARNAGDKGLFHDFLPLFRIRLLKCSHLGASLSARRLAPDISMI